MVKKEDLSMNKENIDTNSLAYTNGISLVPLVFVPKYLEIREIYP